MGIRVIALLAFAFAAAASSISCSTPGAGTASQFPPAPLPEATPAGEMLWELGGTDPIEGFNRSMFAVNHVFLRWVYRPVGGLYGAIVPRPVVNMVNRFAVNIGFPTRLFSCLLQAKWKGSGIVLARFGINTTLGLAGLFDPAAAWFNLPKQDEDFGQAFAAWGIDPGCTLALPGIGVTNIRDGVGMIFDYATDPKSYFYGGQAATYLNAGLDPYMIYEKLWRSSYDTYWSARSAKLLLREMQIQDQDAFNVFSPERLEEARAAIPEAAEAETERPGLTVLESPGWQGAEIDTLKIQFFRPEGDESWWVNVSPWNSDFENICDIRTVRVIDGAEPMPYRFWRNPDKRRDAPLAVLLPGLGGHAVGGLTVPLAEMYHNQGWDVAVISNAFNWQFYRTAMQDGHFPGRTREDAEATRRAIVRVIESLREDGDAVPEVRLAGYSQGALYVLFIADLENSDPLLPLTGCIAYNPPVDMLTGMNRLDEYFRIGESWSREELLERGVRGAAVYMIAAQIAPEVCGEVLPVDRETAGFLIGFSYRMTLTELLMSIHERNPLPGVTLPWKWGGRSDIYRQLANCGYDWYLHCVLAPGADADEIAELNSAGSLYAVRDTLAGDDRVRVFLDADDFLLREEDIDYLTDTVGERLTIFSNGGHLGSLYHPAVRRMLASEIPSRRPEAGDGKE